MSTSIINQVRECLEDGFNMVSVTIFSSADVVFYIYEKEVPICINPITEEVFLDTEAYQGRLFPVEMEELSKAMKVIKENIEEVKEWLGL